MHLFVAITMYEDKVFGKCSESVLNNCINLMGKGHKVTVFYNSELYIDRARNACVKKFLESDCTDLLFVDADLVFDNNAMEKIIKYDRPIVAGSYRLKQIFEHYPVVIDFDRENKNCKEEETGLVWVHSAPTGFMRIQRRVFEELEVHYKPIADTHGMIPFFETGMRIFNDGQWWGEDTAFCRKWTDMGGDVMVEPRLTFTHIGSREYKGNFHEHLMGRAVKNLDKVEEGIAGWMSPTELELLRKLAGEAESIVEVGCWKGRSTKTLLEYCDGTVYAVDHFSGTDSDMSSSLATVGLNVYDEFIKNVGHYKNLKVLKGNSIDIAAGFNGTKVDMVFIDAGHTYEECKADIEAWLPKCRKRICGHDYAENHTGVMQAVDEKFGKENIKVVDSIWFYDIDSQGESLV